MMKHFCLIISMFVSSFANAQDMKRYVQNNTSEIKSIDLNNTNDADLEAFGKAVGDARVVMLGEQDHGDAPTYLAKTRLIKYLHEKKGFNVLAFESDFWSLNYGWDNLPKNDSAQIVDFLSKNIFGIWTYCEAFSPLMKQYIPSTYKTKTPLEIAGFDNQMILGYSDKLAPYLDSVFRKYDLAITHKKDYFNKIIPLIDSLRKGYNSGFAKNNRDIFSDYLDTIYQQLSNTLPTNSFNILLIQNLRSEFEEFTNRSDLMYGYYVRDKQMFENLKWLIKQKYPKDKIMVWAASQHIAKVKSGNSIVINKKRVNVRFMGDYFKDDSSLLKETYVLGFISYQGEAGRQTMERYNILMPKKNSFENWISPKYDYSFTDLASFKNKNFLWKVQPTIV
ncbi:MAG: erythromycin esterase family protein [Arachidicoccus sp.]|nr:erythromycin esterase family protein [Arachidicoccus sp.]